MAARRITIVIDNDPGKERYADIGNGLWGVLKAALPGGGFHLEADDDATAGYLNQRGRNSAARLRGSNRGRRHARRGG